MQSAKDSIHAAAAQDPVGSYERAGMQAGILRRVGNVWQGICPFHADANSPSFTVYPNGTFHCFGCRAHGDLIAFFMRTRNIVSFAEALAELGRVLNVSSSATSPRREPRATKTASTHLPPIPAQVVEGLHAALLADEGRLRWLCTRKALPLSIVKLARLGIGTSPHVKWGGLRFTIPVPDLNDGNAWRDIRGYRPGGTKTGLSKMLPWQAGRGAATVYPWPWVCGMSELVWCEGEVDALNLIARGIGAVTATCGAGGALGSLALPDLSGHSIRVLGDADNAGEEMLAQLPDRLYQAGAERVTVLRWPETLPDGSTIPTGFDVSDYLARTGGDLGGLGL